jgi:hypothetical protein
VGIQRAIWAIEVPDATVEATTQPALDEGVLLGGERLRTVANTWPDSFTGSNPVGATTVTCHPSGNHRDGPWRGRSRTGR